MSKLITHRMQFTSLEDLIDNSVPNWTPENAPRYDTADGPEKMKEVLRRFGKHLLSMMAIELEKAAGKGIQEALTLMQDPAYYETVKRRRKNHKEKQEASNKAYREEYERKLRGEVSEEEKARELKSLEQDELYCRQRLSRILARRSFLEGVAPVEVLEQIDWELPDDLFGEN